MKNIIAVLGFCVFSSISYAKNVMPSETRKSLNLEDFQEGDVLSIKNGNKYLKMNVFKKNGNYILGSKSSISKNSWNKALAQISLNFLKSYRPVQKKSILFMVIDMNIKQATFLHLNSDIIKKLDNRDFGKNDFNNPKNKLTFEKVIPMMEITDSNKVKDVSMTNSFHSENSDFGDKILDGFIDLANKKDKRKYHSGVKQIKTNGRNSYTVICNGSRYGTLTVSNGSICVIDNTHNKPSKCDAFWNVKSASEYLCN